MAAPRHGRRGAPAEGASAGTRLPGLDARGTTKPGLHREGVTGLAVRQAGVWPSGRSGGHRPTRSHSFYRLNWSPAVAEIVGDGRPWTVLMISLLSMPCR